MPHAVLQPPAIDNNNSRASGRSRPRALAC